MHNISSFCIKIFVQNNKAVLLGLITFSVFMAYSGISSKAFAESNPRYASLILDADTGMVLHQRYADKRLHPASLTKVMTLVMVFEALEQGKIGLNDNVYISSNAVKAVPSKLDLKKGSTIKVQDAIYSLVTKSANDVAIALAEHLGRTESGFARMMTKKGRTIGMNHTNFRNASGLHHKDQVSTARDMAKLAQYVINEYPEYYRYFSRQSFTYEGKTYRNHNRLMNKYKGMDGMKTGYIQASGFNLVSSAVRNNRRIIGVVFGGHTSKSRNAHMAKLLDRGFAKLNEIRVASAKVPLPPRKPGILLAMNTLNNVSPSGGIPGEQKWAAIKPALENGMFSRLIGEGDYDPAISQRIETGLIAIAAHRHEMRPVNPATTTLPKRVSTRPNSWAIQVGAFTSRAKTDQALQYTLKKLPGKYSSGSPMIAPLKTSQGWLFRGRLAGYTKAEAFGACKYLQDCLPIAPQNN